MRVRLTAEDIRDIVSEEITNSIDVYRASRKSSELNYQPPIGEPTEEEVDDFIHSNQLLDLDTIIFLTDPGLLGYVAKMDSVRAEWLEEFRNSISDWAETNTWLGADRISVSDLITPEVSNTQLWCPQDQTLEPGWLHKAPAALLLAADLLKKDRPISDLHWRDFEKLIATLLEESGWTVELTRGSKDGGIDVIATKKDQSIGRIKSLWQAKKYSSSNKVRLSHVRELSAIREDQNATKALIVTTSHLTKGALDWVRRDEYRLGYKQKEDVERWIRELT